jgi:hypothetical protein
VLLSSEAVDEENVVGFADLVRSAQVIASPSYTDGMPVSILVSVESGSRIVTGDLPQLKELADRGADIDVVAAHEGREITAAVARQIRPTGATPTLFYQATLSAHASVMNDQRP